ncbi:MAG: hypothetical protein P1V20_14710, partial [Verrucomicrobiales bacterium]|nr:hypothetical protein [Verrucomicrobiales bacterium]
RSQLHLEKLWMRGFTEYLINPDSPRTTQAGPMKRCSLRSQLLLEKMWMRGFTEYLINPDSPRAT